MIGLPNTTLLWYQFLTLWRSLDVSTIDYNWTLAACDNFSWKQRDISGVGSLQNLTGPHFSTLAGRSTRLVAYNFSFSAAYCGVGPRQTVPGPVVETTEHFAPFAFEIQLWCDGTNRLGSFRKVPSVCSPQICGFGSRTNLPGQVVNILWQYLVFTVTRYWIGALLFIGIQDPDTTLLGGRPLQFFRSQGAASPLCGIGPPCKHPWPGGALPFCSRGTVAADFIDFANRARLL